MGDSRADAPAHTEDSLDTADAAAPVRGVAAVQHAIGNAALQRLLRSGNGRRDLMRTARVLARDYEMSPSLFVKDLNIPPPTGPAQPDFSGDTAVNDLPKLSEGDHVWYWAGKSSMANGLPQFEWFGTRAQGQYKDNGGAVYNFVVYPDHVKCGQPHMRTKSKFPGTFAWLNNNPGNLSGLPTSPDIGQYANKFNGSPPDTPNFMVFPTPEVGYEAIPKWLRTNGKGKAYIDMSIRDAWHYYDQADEERYVKLITDALGVPDTTVLNTLTEDQWAKLKAAIKTAEGTLKGWTYDRDDNRLPPAIFKALK